jgi:regulator of sirC expression with transglutaminase-like and TPR domain
MTNPILDLHQAAQPSPSSDVARAVEAILSLPEAELDYARAKVALDALVDPDQDAEWTYAELDRLTELARQRAGAGASEVQKLRALRELIYEPGPWNEFRPYAYDLRDPDGQHLPNKLLHNYLKNRLGQCVSMPTLFLILGERLGLNLALAEAPCHEFIRWVAPDGQTWNLETTSGGHPARLEWFQSAMPMTERALASGLYMRSLGRREAVASMALTVVEHFQQAERWDEVAAVCHLILRAAPRSAAALVAAGSAYGRMLKAEFEDQYPVPFLIPERLRARRLLLIERNSSLLAAAEDLGWAPSELDVE